MGSVSIAGRWWRPRVPSRAARSRRPPAICRMRFANLNYEQYIGIKPVPAARVWAGEGRGFAVEPLHRGFVFANPVLLFTIEDGVVRRLAYDPSRFEFGRVNVPGNLPDIGFSGFRLFSTFGNGEPVEFAIVQGATFFRALARGQNFGLVARGLTLRPAETKGEEIPAFRAFWLERPPAGGNALVVHGLLDSESVAGAVSMTLRPGDMTIVDVETTLFPRVNLDHVGLGGIGRKLPVRAERSSQRRRRQGGGLRGFGPADPERPGRVAVAAGPEPRDAADLRLPRQQSARLRSPAARARLRRLPG